MLPDWLTPALIWVGFLGTLLGPLFILLLPDLGRHKALTQMLTRLALKGGGKLMEASDGPLPVPCFVMQAAGRTLALMPDVAQEDDWAGTLVFEARVAVGGPRLEVHPRVPAARAELAGLVPVTIGDTLMDRAYVAHCADAAAWERMRARLTPALATLASVGEKGAFALSVTPERVQLRRFATPASDGELEVLVVRAAELIGAVFDAGGAAAPAAATPAAVPLCHHCGAALADPRVTCRRCLTPYHEACFRTSGGCTLYPCTCTTPVS